MDKQTPPTFNAELSYGPTRWQLFWLMLRRPWKVSFSFVRGPQRKTIPWTVANPPPWPMPSAPAGLEGIQSAVQDDILWALRYFDGSDKEKLAGAIAGLVIDRLGRCMGVLNA